MTPERWSDIERLYHAARSRNADERAAFLAEACGRDTDLRREVESLLAQESRAGGFMNRPAVAVAGTAGDSTSLIGRELGPYAITARLGAGGMGEVYRARDTKLGRDVAIKILPRLFTSDPERLARFEREARVLAALNHPQIGAIYGLEDLDGCPALILELVEGETLAERLARNKGIGLPVTESVRVARQIAEALEAAHDKGIIHR